MSGATYDAIYLTFKVAGAATLLVLVPGIALAYYFARKHSVFTQILSALVVLPMVLPPTAIGYLLLRCLAMDGPLGPEILGFNLDLLLTWKAAVIASAVMALPLVVRTAKVAFDGVDPRLELLARTLGYGRLHTFLRTTLPLAGRGLFAATILGFTRAVGEFGATITVAGNIPSRTQTLSSAIFSAQQVGNDREAYFLISLSLLLGFFAILTTEFLSRRPEALARA